MDKLDRLERQLSTTPERFTNLESQLDGVHSSLKTNMQQTVMDKLDRLEARLNYTPDKQTGVESQRMLMEKLNSLEAKMGSSNNTTPHAIMDKLNHLESKLATIPQFLNESQELKSVKESVTSKLRMLEERLSTVKEGSSATTVTADKAVTVESYVKEKMRLANLLKMHDRMTRA